MIRQIALSTLGSMLWMSGLAQSPCISTLQGQSCVTFDVVKHGIQQPELYIFHWDFGDGEKGEGPKVTHCYTKSGEFKASLSLTNKENDVYFEDELSLSVNIKPGLELSLLLPDTVVHNEPFDYDIVLDGEKTASPSRVEWFVNSVPGGGGLPNDMLRVGSHIIRAEANVGNDVVLCAEKKLTVVPAADVTYETRFLKDVVHQSEDGWIWSGNSIVLDESTVQLQSVKFDKDQTEVNKSMQAILDVNIDILKRFPSLEVTIGSFTHSGGEFDHNRNLSLIRSEAIRKYMVDKGISADRLQVADPAIASALDNTCADNLGCDYVDEALNLRTDFKISRL